MNRYVVHARRFSGSLAEPTRNDTETDGRDDHAEALRVAESMSVRGWAVWLFEDTTYGVGPSRDFTPYTASGGGRLRTIGEWRPGGTRLR